jgi:hypothetical protein
MCTNYRYRQIVFLLALWVVVASSMPMNYVDEVVPDQDAEEQFLYSYGYGYPGFAYPSVPLAATYPAGKIQILRVIYATSF